MRSYTYIYTLYPHIRIKSYLILPYGFLPHSIFTLVFHLTALFTFYPFRGIVDSHIRKMKLPYPFRIPPFAPPLYAHPLKTEHTKTKKEDDD